MRVETFGLRELIDDMDSTADKIDERAARITKRSVNKIKKDAQQQIRTGDYDPLPHLARSFTTEVTQSRDRVTGEAGASWEMLQGRLDVFIEFGTPTSNPHPHWRPAAEREIPSWLDALDEACVEDLEK